VLIYHLDWKGNSSLYRE